MNSRHPSEYEHQQLARTILDEVPILQEKIAQAVPLPDDQVPTMLREVLRFLHLIAWSNKTLTPPLILDLAWHEFILCTRIYHKICVTHFGRFIHHQPGGTQEENGRQLRTTLKLYHLCFGEPDPRFWGDHGYWSEPAACGACESRESA